jgi:hypothetical protein
MGYGSRRDKARPPRLTVGDPPAKGAENRYELFGIQRHAPAEAPPAHEQCLDRVGVNIEITDDLVWRVTRGELSKDLAGDCTVELVDRRDMVSCAGESLDLTVAVEAPCILYAE